MSVRAKRANALVVLRTVFSVLLVNLIAPVMADNASPNSSALQESVVNSMTESEANEPTSKGLTLEKKRYKEYQDACLKEIDKCNCILKIRPNSIATLRRRALAYAGMRKLNESIADLSQILAVKPDDINILYDRGWLSLTAASDRSPDSSGDKANLRSQFQQLNQALEDFNHVIKIAPKHVEAYLGKAQVYSRLGEFENSVKESSRAIELRPKSPDGYFLRAYSYRDLEQFDNAINDYKLAMRLADKTFSPVVSDALAGAYSERSTSLIDRGQYEEAIEDCNRTIEILTAKESLKGIPSPYLQSAYSNRAKATGILGQYQLAADDYLKFDDELQKVAQYGIPESEAINSFELGALKLCVIPIAENETNPFPYANRANALRVLGAYQSAMTDYGKAIQILSSQPVNSHATTSYQKIMESFSDEWIGRERKLKAWTGQYNNCERMLKDQMSIGWCTSSIVNGHATADKYVTRAQAYLDLGSKTKSIKDCSTAIRMNPRNADAFQIRAAGELASGLIMSALQDLDQAINLEPTRKIEFVNKVRHQADTTSIVSPMLVDDYKTELKRNPKNWIAHILCGDAYMAMAEDALFENLSTKGIPAGAIANEDSKPLNMLDPLDSLVKARADAISEIKSHRKSQKLTSSQPPQGVASLPKSYSQDNSNPMEIGSSRTAMVVPSSLGANTECARYHDAIDEYNLALEFEPLNASVLLSRAKAFEGLREYHCAEKDYNSVMSIAPQGDLTGEAHNGLSRLRWLRTSH